MAFTFVEEPLARAISLSVAEQKIHDLQDWIEIFIDEASSNGLSVLARDKSTQRIVGIILGFDYNFLDHHPSIIADETKFYYYIIEYLDHVKKFMVSINPDFEKINNVIELDFGAVHIKYRGKKILETVIQLSFDLIRKNGYKYACIEVSSFFSKPICIKNKMECWYTEDVTKWNYKGKPILSNIEEIHKEFSFWVKKFN